MTNINDAALMLVKTFEKFQKRDFIKKESQKKYFSYSDFSKKILTYINKYKLDDINANKNILILFDNNIELLAIFMASIICRLVPIIIDPNTSKANIKKIVDNYQPQLIISKEMLDKKVSHIDNQNRATLLNYLPKIRLNDPRSTLYICFTTGSTAKSKEIKISHINFISQISSIAKAYNFKKNDRHYCILPIYHASGLYRTILMPFSIGASTILANKFNVNKFWTTIKNERITFVQVVPLILESLLQNSKLYKIGVQKSSLFIGSASAPLTQTLQTKFERKFKIKVIQSYGATEATCAITVNLSFEKKGCVGTALTTNKIQIIDNEGNVLPFNKHGQIVVSGPSVAVESTANNHIKYKLFTTGDIGYLDDENHLWIIGRKTDFIKRAGHRISPQEIEESILKDIPTINKVAVLGVPNKLLGQDIYAFIEDKDSQHNSRSIIKLLKLSLESYKIPSKIIFLPKFPSIGVGKIDRRQLLKIYLNKTDNCDEHKKTTN